MKYVEFHFCSEENAMYFADYPELDFHKQQHQQLIIKLREMIPSIESKYNDISGLVTFLMNWFIKHTTSEDRKLVEFFKTEE